MYLKHTILSGLIHKYIHTNSLMHKNNYEPRQMHKCQCQNASLFSSTLTAITRNHRHFNTCFFFNYSYSLSESKPQWYPLTKAIKEMWLTRNCNKKLDSIFVSMKAELSLGNGTVRNKAPWKNAICLVVTVDTDDSTWTTNARGCQCLLVT